MSRDRNIKQNHTARDTSPSPPAATERDDDAEAEDTPASKAVDAVPVVLDPFVLTLVPTARHAQPGGPDPRVVFSTAKPERTAPTGASGEPITQEQVRDHLRRRAIFLRELAEARELRERVTPHRARRARIHAALRRRTFRLN